MNGNPWMSALAERAMNHQHNIAWEDATVVDTDMYRRRALEAWYIHRESRPMNRGSFPPKATLRIGCFLLPGLIISEVILPS